MRAKIRSIITAGAQDCTVWGSGLLNSTILKRLNCRKLDVRLVRGPITRTLLQDFGYQVPEFYGDPAIVMPLFYNPDVEKKYEVSVVPHMNEKITSAVDYHQINVVTDDYERFIKEIKEPKLVISSSLHGIILAEVYGVPAILLKPNRDMLKYYDFYYSTNRVKFPIVSSIEEALTISTPKIPDYKKMQDNIIKTFPVDL